MRHSLLALPASLMALTVATLDHRQQPHQHHDQLIHDALHTRQPYVHHRDITRDAQSNPCGSLSEVFEAAFVFPGLPVVVAVPPSVAVACLRSVPVDRERDLRLISYLRPYVSFQSTIEHLADPPDEYLMHGIDVWKGLDEIEARIQGLGYSSQYDVMMDLRSIFVAANDNHFHYPPAILSIFFYVRTYLDFVSLSVDGISPPQVYHRRDLDALGMDPSEAGYEPSPVDEVDDLPVHEWLQREASVKPSNYQDPDAQYNGVFTSVTGYALSRVGSCIISDIEVPDNYTIFFKNDTGLVVQTMTMFAPGVNFTGIDSGETLHEKFEVAPEGSEVDDYFRRSVDVDIAQNPPPPTVSDIVNEILGEEEEEEEQEGQDVDEEVPEEEEEFHLEGYPVPVVIHSMKSVAGYFLEGEEDRDVAVLAIMDFYPVLDSVLAGLAFNITDYILEARTVIADFFLAAQADGRTKLVIDVSENTGGAILLSHEIYRLLFPEGDLSIYDRYRINEAFEAAASAAEYDVFLEELITAFRPQDPFSNSIDEVDEFMGPYTAAGLNVTAPFRRDYSSPWAENIWINGFEPDPSMTTVKEPPFAPENITILTDGICASACASFVDLLTRNHGIRTVALGGRPDELPMQAIGGVRGTLLRTYGDLLSQFWSLTNVVFHSDDVTPHSLSTLSDAVDFTPSFHNPPLKPMAVAKDGSIMGMAGGRVNARNGYSVQDLDGLPLHFQYQAAHCRLFYTYTMATDVRESWRRVAGVTWRGERCVEGSSVGENGTMSDETVGFSPDVRTRVKPGYGPGSLPPRW